MATHVKTHEGSERVKCSHCGADIVRVSVPDKDSADAFKKIKTPPKLLSGLHSPMPSAKHLENKVIPQKDDIINSIIEIIEND